MSHAIARTILLDAAKLAKGRIRTALEVVDRNDEQFREDVDIYLSCLSAADELIKRQGAE